MRLPNNSKVIRKISIFSNIFKYKITRLIKKNGYIAHHGLQRNGTNYLLLILKRCKFSVINDINVKNDSVRPPPLAVAVVVDDDNSMIQSPRINNILNTASPTPNTPTGFEDFE